LRKVIPGAVYRIDWKEGLEKGRQIRRQEVMWALQRGNREQIQTAAQRKRGC
jgi:hypothetical protein